VNSLAYSLSELFIGGAYFDAVLNRFQAHYTLQGIVAESIAAFITNKI
jgi:hypothetical protein